MTSLRTLSAALLAAITLSPAFGPAIAPAFAEDHPEGLHIHDAYARSMGGIGASGAVFFLIHNNTDADMHIVGAKVDVARKAELHTHNMTADGVMQMVEIEGGVMLPAGEMHAFQRGADHVMLMGLTTELQDGDIVPVTLDFEDGTEVAFDAVIDNARKPEDAAKAMEGHDHSHGKMDGHSHGMSGG